MSRKTRKSEFILDTDAESSSSSSNIITRNEKRKKVCAAAATEAKASDAAPNIDSSQLLEQLEMLDKKQSFVAKVRKPQKRKIAADLSDEDGTEPAASGATGDTNSVQTPPPAPKRKKKTAQSLSSEHSRTYLSAVQQPDFSSESPKQKVSLESESEYYDRIVADKSRVTAAVAREKEPESTDAMVVPQSAYNVGTMTRLLQKVNWPPVHQDMSRSACIFVLHFLENLFLIGDSLYEDANGTAPPAPPGSCFDASENDDCSVDRAQLCASSAVAPGSEKLVSRSQRKRGPAPDLDQYCFTYSPDEIKEMIDLHDDLQIAVRIVKRAFGVDEKERSAAGGDSQPQLRYGNVIDTAQVDLLEKGMHTYLFTLHMAMTKHFKLLPIQIKDQHSNALQAAKEAAKMTRSGNRLILQTPSTRDADFKIAGDEPQPINIETRLKDLHHRVANSARYLYTTNLIVSSNNRPHGLPLHLRAFGLMDREANQANSIIEKPLRSRQNYLYYLLQILAIYPLRRHGENFYIEQKSGNFRTQAYVPFCSIEEWVNENVPSSVTDHAMWRIATEDTNTTRWVIDYLKKVVHKHDNVLCNLVSIRHQFSFKNGIYTAHNNRFWRYDTTYLNEPECPLGNSDCISANYIDKVFDEKNIACGIDDIETPVFDSIMETQGFSKQVKYFFRLFCGRMMYDVNDRDKWQVVPILIGFGGTGKSSVLEIIKAMYTAGDVGVMQNKCEDLFGLQSLYTKKILLCTDIRPDWALNQGTFQNMACGEGMSIAQKHRDAVQMPNWLAPMMLASNTGLGYKDDGNAVTRRLMPFYFNTPVRPDKIRPNLIDDLLKELPNIMVKNNRCYFEVLKKWGSAPLNTILPPDMRRNHQELRRDCNVIETYIKHCPRCDVSETEAYVTKSEFVAAIRHYMHDDFGKKFEAPSENDFLQQLKSAFDESVAANNTDNDKSDQTEENKKHEYAPRYVKTVTLPNGTSEVRIYGIRLPMKNDHSHLLATTCVFPPAPAAAKKDA